jgi:hypothetical protein
MVLKRKQVVASKRERRIASALLLVFLAAFVLVFFPLFEGVDWSRAPRNLMPPAELLVEVIGALLIAVGLIWHNVRSKKLERLYVDERGIRYESPLPSWLASLQPGWSHSWSEIAVARIVIPRLAFNLNMAAIVIEAGAARRKLPGMWVPADGGVETPEQSFMFRSHEVIAAQIARHMNESALARALRSRGVKVEMRETQRVAFALERNRASLGALALVFLLIAYAIVDWIANSETYAVMPPVQLYLLAGMLAMLASVITLALNRVPHAEAWGVSIVLGAAFAFALYPGLLRVNQISDNEGLKPQRYRLADYVLFQPLDARLPDLVFVDYHEYWQQFPRGSEHEFLMRTGGLGFPQIEMAPVHERMREFYRR